MGWYINPCYVLYNLYHLSFTLFLHKWCLMPSLLLALKPLKTRQKKGKSITHSLTIQTSLTPLVQSKRTCKSSHPSTIATPRTSNLNFPYRRYHPPLTHGMCWYQHQPSRGDYSSGHLSWRLHAVLAVPCRYWHWHLIPLGPGFVVL